MGGVYDCDLWYRTNGKCPACGGELPFGYSRCFPCQHKERVKRIESVKKETVACSLTKILRKVITRS